MRVNKTPTLTANAALDPYLRVKISSSKLVAADDTDKEIGTLVGRVLAADDPAAVVPRNVEGTVKMVALTSFAQFATVYGANGGKIDDVSNSNEIGIALQAASGNNSIVEVLRTANNATLAAFASDVIIDEDFVGDWPAAGTALTGQGAYSWTKTETLGLGVISSDVANGVVKCVFDAVAEAATATLFMENSPVDIDQGPVMEARVAIFDIGDHAALDIDIGLASDDHATDFEAIAAFVAIHLDGTSLNIMAHSDDGTTDVAAVDTTKDAVDNTYFLVKIDCTDKTDIKISLDMDGNGYVRVLSGTTFTLAAYSGALTPIVMVEKSNNDTLADVRVDRIRVRAGRN